MARRANDYLIGNINEGSSLRFEEEDGDLSNVEVDEMADLVGDEGAEVPAHDAVPGGVVVPVEVGFDGHRHLFLILQSLHRAANSLILHFGTHVALLNLKIFDLTALLHPK